MSLPVKIAIGTLGGGTVAVGGYEALSYATGKSGLLFDHSNVAQQSEQQITPPNAEEIKTLLDTLKTKCTIKIKKAPEAETEVTRDTANETLISIYEELKKLNDGGQCSSSQQNKKIVVLEGNEQNTWTQKITDVQTESTKISNVTSNWKGRCVLKVKLDNEEALKEISAVTNDSSLAGLDGQLSNACPENSSPQGKVIVFQKSGGNWTLFTDKQQVEAWKQKQEKFKDGKKCVLKLFSVNGNQDLSGDSVDLVGLPDFLSTKATDVNNACKSDSAAKPYEVVLKKTESVWKVMTELDQIKEIVQQQSFNCEVKFKATNAETKDVKNANEGEVVDGLLVKIKSLSTDCNQSSSQKKLKIFKHESSNWVEFTDREYLQDLTKGKCTLKIREKKAGEDTQTEDKDLDKATDLGGLYDVIYKDKDSLCTGGTSQQLTYQKESSGSWTKL